VRADSNFVRGDSNISLAQNQMDYFNVIDLNHDGEISQTEAIEFFSAIGVAATQSQISEIYAVCGKGATQLNLGDFVCAIGLVASVGDTVIPYNPQASDMITQRNAAFACGAQFVSTDWETIPFLGADPTTNYWVQTPGDYLYRCNPITTANISCHDSDFENSTTTTGYMTSFYLTTDSITSGQLTTGQTSQLNSGADSIVHNFCFIIIAVLLLQIF